MHFYNYFRYTPNFFRSSNYRWELNPLCENPNFYLELLMTVREVIVHYSNGNTYLFHFRKSPQCTYTTNISIAYRHDTYLYIILQQLNTAIKESFIHSSIKCMEGIVCGSLFCICIMITVFGLLILMLLPIS